MAGRAKVNFLLDTHIWIWALARPEKLSRAVRRQIENPKSELYLSPVSVWEAHHLVRRGKLRPKKDFAAWLDQALTQVPIKEAPFNFAIIFQVAKSARARVSARRAINMSAALIAMPQPFRPSYPLPVTTKSSRIR